MVMIRCPGCGQTVLDVASSCPKCGRNLIQNPLETHDWGALQACGRCGKHIERQATVCPYCGHHVHAARTMWRTAAGVIAVAVIVVGAIALWRSGLPASLRESLVTSRSAAPDSTPVTATEARGAEPTAPAIVAKAPEQTAAVSNAPSARPDTARRAPPAAPPIVQRPQPASETLDLTTRWTNNWANVRADRSIDAPPVRVLRPGEEVAVGDMRSGWWAVYVNGRILGYIANSLLQLEPPGTE